MNTTKVIRMVDSKVDDVAISCNLFRMEQMDKGFWWIAVYRGQERTSFRITIKDNDIVVEVQEDAIGCIDDTKQSNRQR